MNRSRTTVRALWAWVERLETRTVPSTLTVSNTTVMQSATATVNAQVTITDSLPLYTLSYSTSDGTAVAGTDYTQTNGTRLATSGSGFTLSIPILPNPSFHAPLTFTVSGSDGVGGTGTGTVTIDPAVSAPTVALSQSSATINDSGGTDTITATISAASSTATMVTLGFTGTAQMNTNFTASPTTINIAANQTTGTATITGVNTHTFAPDTAVTTTISTVTGGGGAIVGSPNLVTTTIHNTTPAPGTVTLSQSSATINDTGGTDTITATNSVAEPTDTMVTLAFSGSAVTGTNYTVSPTTIDIPANQTTGTATITGVPTHTFGPDVSLTTTISGVTGGGGSAAGSPNSVMTTIHNTTPLPTLTLSATGSPMSEMGGVATVTATLSGPEAMDVTTPLTFGGTAVQGTNYTASANSIKIKAGQTTGSITLTGVDDMKFTPNLTVTVGDANDNTVAPASVIVMNVDPPPTVALSATGSPFKEMGGTATLTATLSAASGFATTVNLAYSGTAVQGTNYTAPASIIIPAGQTTGTATVTGIDDMKFSNGYTVVAAISSATNATPMGTTSVTLNEAECSPPPTVTLAESGSPLAENGGLATVTATQNEVSLLPTTVNLVFAGTAKSGKQYTTTGSTITIPAGSTTGSVLITGVDDNTFGPDVTVTTAIASVTNGQFTPPQQVTATITEGDNKPLVTLSQMGSPAAENGGVATVTATLSAPSGFDTTVNLGFAGSAISGTQYMASGSSILIPAGSTTGAIAITGVDDGVFGPNVNVVTSITSATNATVPGNQAVSTTITEGDQPPAVTLTESGSPAPENGGVVTVTANLANASGLPATINLAFGGTAAPGVNYTASGSSISIPAGQKTGSVTLSSMDDMKFGPDLTVATSIASATGATPSGPAVTATFSESSAAPALSVNSFTLSQDSPTANFTVTLAAPSTLPATVNYFTNDGTATGGVDYAPVSGLLTFAPGETAKVVTVTILKDPVYESPTETFTLNLVNPVGASIGSGVGTATLLTTGQPPAITPNDTALTKPTAGTVNATVTVQLSAASEVPATVSYSTSDITAVAGTDYASTSGTLTFAPGQTTQTISIPIIGTTTPEGDRTFAVNLSGPMGATLAKNQAIVTLHDPNPPVGLYIDNATVNVSGASPTTATFNVHLARPSGQTVTVNYATSNGSAVAGTDYLPAGGSLTFTPGTTSLPVNVTVLGASVPEAIKQFFVNLSMPVNSTVSIGQATGTIVDTIANPSLAIDSVTVVQPHAGATGAAVFTVELSGQSGLPVTVNYATSGITAVPGTDYAQTSGQLTFAPGQAVQSITVPLIGSNVLAPDKTFAISLFAPLNATIGTGRGTATILNSNLMPVLTASDARVALPAAGATGTASFTVVLSTAVPVPVTVNYATADGSAVSGVDYAATAGQLTFAPGQTMQTVNVTVFGNGLSGPNKQFTLNLSSPQNATLFRAQGQGIIVNGNPLPLVSINSLTLTNTSPTAALTVSLSSPSAQPVTVGYSTADGTAQAGLDFTATTGTVTFQPGQTTQLVAVPILKDTVYELTESFTVNLANPTNAALLNGQGTVTVLTNALPPLVTAGDFSQLKPTAGSVNATATLQLSAPSELPVTVTYHTSDITAQAGIDYVATTGTATFAPGQVVQTVGIPIIGSTTPEGTRTFALNLDTVTGGSIARAQAVGTINDPNPPAGLFIDNTTVTQSGPNPTTATFNVHLASVSGQTVTVNYATANGTALLNTDYLLTSGTLTFSPGQTTQTITVPILGATVPEPTETFTVNLTNPVNSTVMTAQATGTIINTVAAPALAIDSVATILPTSGMGSAVFHVSLSGPSNLPVTVNYTTANSSALAGIDYTAVNGTLTFAPGQTVQTLAVPILPSTALGPDKTFNVLLSGASNATIATMQGVGTIQNNNLVRDLTVNDVRAALPAANTTATATFTVSLSAPSPVAVTVNYATADMTALAGTDYLAAAGQLLFAPGETTKMVSVTLVGNGLSGPNKQFTLNLSSPQNATVTRAQGLGIIVNDNPLPLFTVNSVTAANTSPSTTFTVALSAASAQPITVTYSTADGTALAGADYTATSGTLNFQPGQTSQLVTVPLVKDTLFGFPTKTFTLNLANPTNAALLTGQGTATIVENNLPPSASAADFSQLKSTAGSVNATATIQLSAPSQAPVTVFYHTADITAVAGTDYVTTIGSVTFAPGEVTKLVPIPILGSTTPEGTRTFALDLDMATGGTIGRPQAIGTILDPNPPVGLYVDGTTATVSGPANTTATFNVHLAQPSGQVVQVNYATANGSAQAGTDYLPATGIITFSPGQTTQTVTVTVLGATVPQPTRTFSLNLTNPVNSTVSIGQATATIFNTVMSPSLSIDDVTVNDAPTGTLAAVFHVTLSAPSGLPVTVNYSTSDITARAGADYTPELGSLIFAPGQTVETVTVPVANQTQPAPNKQFALNLSGVANAALLKAQGVATIDNTNLLPRLLTVGDVQVAAGSAGGTAVFTVTLSSPSTSPVTVQYATADLTALAGTDYQGTAGLVTFPAGQTTETIDVSVNGVTTPGPNKQFALKLTNPTNSTLARAQALGTIVNTVPAPTLAIDDVTVTDTPTGALSAVFHVSLSTLSGQAVTVNFNTSDGSAQAGVDYTAAQGTLTFAPGQTVQTITVPVTNHNQPLPDKNFTVVLTGASSATLGKAAGTATIVNNNLTPRLLLLNDVQVPDGPAGATATFTATLSSPSNVTVTVQYATADMTAVAGTDYLPANGLLTFAPGQTSQSFNVSILGVTLSGPNKQFAVKLTNATNSELARTQAVGTIVNTVAQPVLSVNNVGTANTSPNVVFTVSLSAPSSQPITVTYSTADGTALAGADYTATTGTLTFQPGQTSQLVTVPLLKDTLFGFPTKTFTLNLANPTNAALLTGQGTATIVENNLPPSASAADFSQLKSTAGSVNATATIQLSAPSQAPVTVFYHTADITAVAGTDYVATIGSVTFAPGEVTKLVPIPILGSTTPEGTRTFALDLDMATGGTIGRPQAIGTILDPNPPVGLFIENTTVTQAGPAVTSALFTVHLAQASGQTVMVAYATANGTALAGTDYLPTSGILTFAPGQTTQTITVPILGATAPSPIKTFTVNLSNPVNSTVMTAQATGTIINTVAAPALAIDSVATILPTMGTASAVFHVSLSGSSNLPITVNYTTANSTALAGIDYTAVNGTLTFAPGQTVQTLAVPILPSTALGPDKTFNVLLSGASNATIATMQGVGTIQNNNLVRDLTVNDVRAALPAANTTGTANFTVTLSVPSPVAVTVNYATADMTAVAGSDYLATAGQLLFAPGETTKMVSVTLVGNGLSGPNKQFTLNLTSPQNATVTRAQGLGIIVNGNAQPLFSVGDVSTTNASASAVFTVTLSRPSAEPITVQYATMDGTASAGTDYTAISGTLTFAPGVTSQTVSAPIIKGTMYGPDKTFTLVLSNASNAGLLVDQATATIKNVSPAPQVSVADFSVTKPAAGTAPAVATLQLSAPSGLPVTVQYATADGSAVAGVDYTSTIGSVTFQPGQTSQTVSVPVLGNTTPKGNLKFVLNLTQASGGTIARAQATGTIIDPNPPVGLSVDNPSVIQTTAGSIATFHVTLAQASGLPVSVSYNTANQTATAGHDYLSVQGTLTFAPGQTQMTVSVSILGENVPEDPESFALLLTNPVNTTITTPQGVTTILNTVAGPNLTIAGAQVVKPHTGTVNAVFNVTLSQPSAQVITVSYATIDGTAVANANYIPTTGMLTFAPGETVKTITVPVLGNTTPGPNTQFFVNLSGASNALVTQGQATGTIIDRDTIPAVSVNNVSVVTGPLGPFNAVFTISLSVVGTLPVTVNFATMDGTALSGRDYTPESGTLTFAPGETAKTITVPVASTATPGPNTQFTLNLSGPTNSTILLGQGTATLINGNLAPSVSVGNATVTAPAGGTTNAVFTVQLSGPSQLPIAVNYATSDNTALAGRDYTTTSGTLTFVPGQTIKTFAVPVLAGPLFAATRTFNVTLNGPSNATIGNGQGVGTILNNVPAPVLTVGNATVTEPAFGNVLANFNVSLSAPSGEAVTVAYATQDGSAVAGTDYTPVSGTLTFAPGQTSQTVGVPVLATDNVYDGNPTKVFLLTVSNPVNATLGNLQGIGTIRETEGPPSLSINDVTVIEGDLTSVNAVFAVTLSSPSVLTTQVSYATADLNSVAGRDYIPTSGTLTFAPGQTVQFITVPVLDNLLPGNETFIVNLFSPVNATIARGTGFGNVIDNDRLVVTNTNDSGPGSLRQEIIRANLIPGPNTILFAIPGPGPYEIAVRSPLPTITDPVAIDARSQPGYGGTPVVVLNGAGAGFGVNGLTITGGNSGVFGLNINRFGGSGIEIAGRGGDTVAADYIGTTLDGNFGLGNIGYGVEISNSSSNLIGGPNPNDRNVISGNLQGGIHIDPSSNNLVVGNYIGTNAAGNAAVANGNNGIYLENAPFNTVTGNVISGNGTNGVKIYGLGSMRNRVLGNIVGGSAGGGAWLGNQGYGIIVNNVSARARNVTNPNNVTTNTLGRFFSGKRFGRFHHH